MCGRFALGIPKKRLEELFTAPVPDEYMARFNTAPGHEILTVTPGGMEYRKWGLVPHWAKDPAVGFKMTNARSETVFEKPAFRDPVRQARCLVPVQAFYEWKASDSGKQPYAIDVAGTDAFAMAGIMAHWRDVQTGEVIDSVTIVTCAPNTLMERIHHRMPVILPPDAWGAWLDSANQRVDTLSDLLVPYPSSGMRAWPVSTVVNKVVHDGPDLLARVEILQQGRLF